jgi:hypothetical protein
VSGDEDPRTTGNLLAEMTERATLDVGGVSVLTAEQGHRLAYAFPEGAAMPKTLQDFLVGEDVDAAELAAVLEGEARRAAADSDEALELMLLAQRRLRDILDSGGSGG